MQNSGTHFNSLQITDRKHCKYFSKISVILLCNFLWVLPVFVSFQFQTEGQRRFYVICCLLLSNIATGI